MIINNDKALNELVQVLVNEIPDLEEIRVFGSYTNKNWNPETSDIDIFVLTNNEHYYSLKDIQHTINYTILESKQRQELRKRIIDKLASDTEKK